MASEVGNSVSWPEYEEVSEEYSSKFQDILDRWQNQDSELEVPADHQEKSFNSTLGFWKDHDSKRRRAKAPHRHSIRKRIINEFKENADGASVPLPPREVEEVVHDHGNHQYSPESPCVYIPPARPLTEAVPSPSDEEVYDEDDEEVLEELPRWNWVRGAIVGGITLAATIGIPIAYKYAMAYYYPEEEDCNCINDGIWKFVTRTLFKMREPKPVRKPFFGWF